MRSACFNLGVALLSMTCASGLYASQLFESETPAETAQSLKIYSAGQGVTAPVLITNAGPANVDKKCKPIFHAVSEFTIIVDTEGRPRNIYPARPIGTELDQFALQIISRDLFKPGMFQGQPVPVGRLVDVSFPVCYRQSPDPAETRDHMLAGASQAFDNIPFPPDAATLTSLSEPANGTSTSVQAQSGSPTIANNTQEQQDFFTDLEKTGKDVTEPIIIKAPYPKYPDQLVKKFVVEICVLELIVDPQGMPRNIHLLRHQNPVLDQLAIDTVQQYRFRPATRNGRPVAVPIDTEVHFHPGRN
jgi:TonB family protein